MTGWRKRKGFIITEAAMIFPLVALTVVVILCILLAVYWKTAAFSTLYKAGRESAAYLTQTVYYGEQEHLYEQRLYDFFQDRKKTDQEMLAIVERNFGHSPLPTAGNKVNTSYLRRVPFAQLELAAILDLDRLTLLGNAQRKELLVRTTAVDEAQFIRTADFLTELGEGWSFVEHEK